MSTVRLAPSSTEVRTVTGRRKQPTRPRRPVQSPEGEAHRPRRARGCGGDRDDPERPACLVGTLEEPSARRGRRPTIAAGDVRLTPAPGRECNSVRWHAHRDEAGVVPGAGSRRARALPGGLHARPGPPLRSLNGALSTSRAWNIGHASASRITASGETRCQVTSFLADWKRATVKLIISGTSTAKRTSIAVSTTSGPPRVWSRTKANSIRPAAITYESSVHLPTRKLVPREPSRPHQHHEVRDSRRPLAAARPIGTASGGLLGEYDAM